MGLCVEHCSVVLRKTNKLTNKLVVHMHMYMYTWMDSKHIYVYTHTFVISLSSDMLVHKVRLGCTTEVK